MLLGDILHAGLIKTTIESTENYAAITELTDVLITAGEIPISLRDHALEAIAARERSMSTGMEHGVALPHASSPRVDKIVGVLGISKAGIPWDCLDCEPARLVILLLLPRSKFQMHVRALAGISHLLNSDAFCDRLVDARDEAEVLRLIHAEEKSSIFDDYR
jgi:mannitol/fructose-specific phosphotransferase system IIA component (Ntr-type)